MTAIKLLRDSFWIDRITPHNNISVADVRKKTTLKVIRNLAGLCQNQVFGLSLIIRKQVDQAGSGGMGVEKFRVFKAILVVVALVVGSLLMVTGGPSNAGKVAVWLPALVLVGFILPDFYIKEKTSQRAFDVDFHFPAFLDLLALYTSSEGFDNLGNAIVNISRHARGIMGVELRSLVTSYRFVDRDTFFDAMQRRFDSPLARELASTVKLTEKYGGKIGEKITSLAYEANKDRLQKAKKRGQASAVTLMIPLMLFHFPVALFLMIGPIIMSLSKTLGN